MSAYLIDGKDHTDEACSKAPNSESYDQGCVSGSWKEQLLRLHSKKGGCQTFEGVRAVTSGNPPYGKEIGRKGEEPLSNEFIV